MLLVFFLVWLAYTTILGYQVSIQTSAGLGLGIAGTIEGLRDFGQLFGRIGLIGVVERFGADRLLRLAYAVSPLA